MLMLMPVLLRATPAHVSAHGVTRCSCCCCRCCWSPHRRRFSRGVDLETARLTVNGNVQKLVGWNHHTQWPVTAASPTDDQIAADVKLLKAAGTTYVRGAHYPHVSSQRPCRSLPRRPFLFTRPHVVFLLSFADAKLFVCNRRTRGCWMRVTNTHDPQ